MQEIAPHISDADKDREVPPHRWGPRDSGELSLEDIVQLDTTDYNLKRVGEFKTRRRQRRQHPRSSKMSTESDMTNRTGLSRWNGQSQSKQAGKDAYHHLELADDLKLIDDDLKSLEIKKELIKQGIEEMFQGLQQVLTLTSSGTDRKDHRNSRHSLNILSEFTKKYQELINTEQMINDARIEKLIAQQYLTTVNDERSLLRVLRPLYDRIVNYAQAVKKDVELDLSANSFLGDKQESLSLQACQSIGSILSAIAKNLICIEKLHAAAVDGRMEDKMTNKGTAQPNHDGMTSHDSSIFPTVRLEPIVRNTATQVNLPHLEFKKPQNTRKLKISESDKFMLLHVDSCSLPTCKPTMDSSAEGFDSGMLMVDSLNRNKTRVKNMVHELQNGSTVSQDRENRFVSELCQNLEVDNFEVGVNTINYLHMTGAIKECSCKVDQQMPKLNVRKLGVEGKFYDKEEAVLKRFDRNAIKWQICRLQHVKQRRTYYNQIRDKHSANTRRLNEMTQAFQTETMQGL